MLLQTKLFMPQIREGLIHRAELIAQLDEIFQTGMATVCAPPGYGKTTLITQWLSLKNTRHCWVSLDNRDNDASVFWQYLITAIAQLDNRFISHAYSAESRPLNTTDLTTRIDALIAELIEFSRTWKSPSQFILVLDDYHVISNPAIHDQLNHFINYTPDWLKFIVTSRREPPLDLPRRRVRQQVTEIDDSDLSFSLAECRHFLNTRLALDLTETELSMLHNRTEGWVAAIQLAALSLKRRTEKETFIRSFSGKEALLSSYLLSEVFELQSDYVQSFLLRLAIVPRFCDALAEVITGHKNSQQLIENLRSQNLLIVPLDDKNHWFRFHDLFREWLENQHSKHAVEDIAQVRHRAADWLEESGYTAEALEQYLELKQWSRASQLSGRLLPELARNGEFTLARSIVEKFPESFVLTQPKLCFLKALDYFHRELYVDALHFVELTEKSLLSLTPDHDEAFFTTLGFEPGDNLDELKATCIFLNNQINRFTGKIHNKLQVESALQLNISSSSDIYGWTLYGVASEQFANNELITAEENLLKSIKVSQQKNDPFCLIAGISWLTPTLYHQGKINAGLKMIEELDHWLEPFNPDSLPNYMTINYAKTSFYLEMNRLQDAQTTHTEATTRWGHSLEPLNQIYWKFQELQLNLSLDNLEAAENSLDDLESIFRIHFKEWQFVIPSPEIFRALIHLKRGNAAPFIQWAQHFEEHPPHTNPFRLQEEQLMLARALILQERDPMPLLNSIRAAAKSNNIVVRLIFCDLLETYWWGSQGQLGQALESFAKVLNRASKHGYVRLLIGEGAPIKPLLQSSIQLGIEAEYAQKILTLMDQQPEKSTTQAPVSTTASGQPSSTLEALSSREIQVLKLINEGNPNKVIASRLSVATTTVKSHIRNIYSKLGVHRRTQALAIARAEGIIE